MRVLPVVAGVMLATVPAAGQKSPRISVVADFDTALQRAMGQPPKFSVDLYLHMIQLARRSFVPEGDSLKPLLLSALSTTSGHAADLGMIAAALIPFHDPATVKPLLDRAARDSVLPFIATSVAAAAASVLSMTDAAPQPKPGGRGWALLLGAADSALATSIGHVYAWRLRRVYDAGHAQSPPGGDYCEGMMDVSAYVVGVLDLRDLNVLEPMVDTAGSCAVGGVMLALSYAANQDFVSSWGTIREPDARIQAVTAATVRARQWWRDYLREHPDGDWRPAARAGLRARGYVLDDDPRSARSSKALLEALNDTSKVIRFNAYRLLNAVYDTHADLDPIFGFGYYAPNEGYSPADAVASDTTLRNYWRRRLAGR